MYDTQKEELAKALDALNEAIKAKVYLKKSRRKADIPLSEIPFARNRFKPNGIAPVRKLETGITRNIKNYKQPRTRGPWERFISLSLVKAFLKAIKWW